MTEAERTSGAWRDAKRESARPRLPQATEIRKGQDSMAGRRPILNARYAIQNANLG